jgi:hypothetical protein
MALIWLLAFRKLRAVHQYGISRNISISSSHVNVVANQRPFLRKFVNSVQHELLMNGGPGMSPLLSMLRFYLVPKTDGITPR